MKTFFKIVLVIIVVFIMVFAAQKVIGFDLGKLINSVILKDITINMGQETLIPVFQIVSLESFFPNNIGIMSAEVFKIIGMEFGEVTLLYEYDSYAKFGVRNPEKIKIERVDNILYVDEASIIIELLDFKIDNFKYRTTSGSNFSVRSNMDDASIFEALNRINKEHREKMIKNGRANFEFAKKNFMDNYKNMCNAMDLKVVWR